MNTPTISQPQQVEANVFFEINRAADFFLALCYGHIAQLFGQCLRMVQVTLADDCVLPTSHNFTKQTGFNLKILAERFVVFIGSLNIHDINLSIRWCVNSLTNQLGKCIDAEPLFDWMMLRGGVSNA